MHRYRRRENDPGQDKAGNKPIAGGPVAVRILLLSLILVHMDRGMQVSFPDDFFLAR